MNTNNDLRKCRKSIRLSVVGAAVAATGICLIFMANRWSWHRTPPPVLVRTEPARSVALPATAKLPEAVWTNSPTSASNILSRLERKGLKLADVARAIEWFHDPRYELGVIVFVDARNDQHYQEGHIPGAHQYDPYRPDQYLMPVLPTCLMAEVVMIYCNGGDCEDSEFAAIALRNAGVSADRLFVFAGGISEWSAAGGPVE